MLIDKIILSKTNHSPDSFTGGNIQVSTSKYTFQLSIKLVLYFGFNLSRNPISVQLDIKEKDVSVVTKELIAKSKLRITELQNSSKNKILDLDEINDFVDIRNEGGKRSQRGDTNDSDSGDSVDSKIVDSPTNKMLSEQFAYIWKDHIFQIRTKTGRTNYGSKPKAEKIFIKTYRTIEKAYPDQNRDDILDLIYNYVQRSWQKDKNSDKYFIQHLQNLLDGETILSEIEMEDENGV